MRGRQSAQNLTIGKNSNGSARVTMAFCLTDRGAAASPEQFRQEGLECTRAPGASATEVLASSSRLFRNDNLSHFEFMVPRERKEFQPEYR